MSEMTDFCAVSGRLPGFLRKVCIQADQLLRAMVGTFGFGTVTPPIYTDPVNTVGVSTKSFESFLFLPKGISP